MLKENAKIPNCSFKIIKDGKWEELTYNNLFKDKRVVLFALPGAFTPTCSSQHIPGYLKNYDEIKSYNIDAIYCLSVNDTFVMNAWAKDQNTADKITMIPDGNCEFTEGMQLVSDKKHLGFGKRSWRYAVVINDGIIEKIFSEDQNSSTPDPFEASKAETVLTYLKSKV